MFRFFRKIRENLLLQGKTAKYLKYAVGEVFLVVIGILLALWINNLNNKRLNKITERQILENIKNDLNQQLKDIDSSLLWTNNQLLKIEQIKTEYKEKKSLAKIDSLDVKLQSLLETDYLPLNNSAFFQIRATGEIDLISNQGLKSDLIIFYNRLSDLNKNIDFDYQTEYYPNVNNKILPFIAVASSDSTFLQSDRLSQTMKLQLKNPEVEFGILNAITLAENYTKGMDDIYLNFKKYTIIFINAIEKNME